MDLPSGLLPLNLRFLIPFQPFEILSVPRYSLLVRYRYWICLFLLPIVNNISGFNWYVGFWWRLLILGRLFHGFQVKIRFEVLGSFPAK